MSPLSESCDSDREIGKPLSLFCMEFGVREEDLGQVTRIGRRCFLVDGSNRDLIEIQKTLKEKKTDIFGVGIYLGEEKRRFAPSPALIELIAARTDEHKAIVDAKSAWLFLCGRDVFGKAIVRSDDPTGSGYLLVQNEQDESLGYGLLPSAGARRRSKNVAIRNLLDRGFFLRRERLA